MESNYKNKTGQIGENVAANYLVKRGYSIIQRNYRTGHKEIDIIARHNSLLVFVEVKTRTLKSLGDGSEAMNNKKNHNLARAAELFLNYFEWSGDIRFDLILVQINYDKKIANIKHFLNVN